MSDIKTIKQMLAYRRVADGRSEAEFIKRFIMPHGFEVDGYGNLYKRVGDAPILWSAHTDTVHSTDGFQNITEKDGILGVDSVPGQLKYYQTSPGHYKSFWMGRDVLGADNGAGCWMLLELLKSGMEGLYVFHREEESGGRGANWIVENNPKLVDGILCAIAFDRRGKDSIITHQIARSCSDAFARSLAEQIGMDHKPDATGVFTDTAVYTDLIGECTNVSVGFQHEHSESETLDTNYLFELRDRMVSLNWHDLVFEREPGEADDEYWWERTAIPKSYETKSVWDMDLDELVMNYPGDTAELMRAYGISTNDLLQQIVGES